MRGFHRVLLGAVAGFLLLAVALVGYREYAFREAAQVVGQRAARASTERHRQQQDARDAFAALWNSDAIGDKLQRCLSFPNPPDVHWDAGLIAELCRYSSFDIVSIDELASRIARKDAVGLDEIFDRYVDQNASDPAKKGMLIRVYNALFYNDDIRMDAIVDTWVELAPHSANALAARGVHRVARAYSVRESYLSSQTPSDKMDAMTRLMNSGKSDLDAAQRIKPDFLVPPVYLAYALMPEGNSQEAGAHGRRAFEIDPTDQQVYFAWLSAVSPMWGGSATELHDVVAASKPYRDAHSLLALVEARALLLELQAGNHELSKAEYVRVLAIGPDMRALRGIATRTSGEAKLFYISQLIRFDPTVENYLFRIADLRAVRRNDELERDLKMASSVSVTSPTDPKDLAWLLKETGKSKDAADIYEKMLALDPSNSEAMFALVQLYQSDLKRHDDALAMAKRMTVQYPLVPQSFYALALATKESDPTTYCEAMTKYFGDRVPMKQWDNEKMCNVQSR